MYKVRISYELTSYLQDNGTDKSALNLADTPETMTVGPLMFEYINNPGVGNVSPSPSDHIFVNDAFAIKLCCEVATTPADAIPTCTESVGPAVVREIQCQSDGPTTTETIIRSVVFTYSGRGTYSAGVETVLNTFAFAPHSTPVPGWCSRSAHVPNPSVKTATRSRDQFATYQLVITAGQERLGAGTTAAASVTGDSAVGSKASGSATTPTGSAASGTPTGSVSSAQDTGAAVPVKTAGSVMVVGLGAAVVAFVM
jgi:hypothetical protein